MNQHSGDTPQWSDLYDHIESWWGEKFEDALIPRIVSAPVEQQRVFAREMDHFIMELGMSIDRLPEVRSGILRPVLVRDLSESRLACRLEAARVLCYAHEIVLDTGDYFPNFDPHRRENTFEADLTQLVRLRPLVVDGSIKFTSISSRVRHPSLAGFMENLIGLPGIWQIASEPVPIPASSSPNAPRERRTQSDRTGPVSHINWRTTVAHHPTEDTCVASRWRE